MSNLQQQTFGSTYDTTAVRHRVLRNTYWLLALSTVSYTHLTLPTKA